VIGGHSAEHVPAIFLTTGLHPDYHTPQDDVGRSSFSKLEKIARLAYRVSWRLVTIRTCLHTWIHMAEEVRVNNQSSEDQPGTAPQLPSELPVLPLRRSSCFR
jgi:hypothetical protein